MPNIGAVLKEEIARLSRREIRRHAGPQKKAISSSRRQIAGLKVQVAKLEQQLRALSSLTRRGPKEPQDAPESGARKPRFFASGLRSQRERLGLSAAEFAKLAGVSAQSIYNWEHKRAAPRASQVATLASLRGLGKKEARARLDQHASAKAGKRATRKRRAKRR